MRKGTTTPYIAHLLAVTSLVLEDDGDEDDAMAALLHDAAEDQGGREQLEDIRSRFGQRVAEIVEACGDTFETPKPPWRERKQSYLQHLESAPDEVLRISLADKLHNIRAITLDYERLGDELGNGSIRTLISSGTTERSQSSLLGDGPTFTPRN